MTSESIHQNTTSTRHPYSTGTLAQDTPIHLKWSSCDKGQQDNQLHNPCGISIDRICDDIYVADNQSSRIQIFSGNGEWIASLKDEEMIEPENILFLHNSTFVQCNRKIVKFHRCTLKRESYKSYRYMLSGICTDNTHIYVGEYLNMKLTILTPDLEEVRRISLNTQFCEYDTLISDISLARDEVYVCFAYPEYPIQAFTKQGILTRCVVHKDMLVYGWYFCIDQHFNILVSDYGCCQVKIFSNDGKLMYTFGNEGSAPGEFTGLIGISVNDLCHIVTVDYEKEHNKLQAFSYY